METTARCFCLTEAGTYGMHSVFWGRVCMVLILFPGPECLCSTWISAIEGISQGKIRDCTDTENQISHLSLTLPKL